MPSFFLICIFLLRASFLYLPLGLSLSFFFSRVSLSFFSLVSLALSFLLFLSFHIRFTCLLISHSPHYPNIPDNHLPLPPPAAAPKRLALEKYPFPDFHPHGIEALNTADSTLLLVVNHRRNGEFIDFFTLNAAENTVTYTGTVGHALFRNLNDVAAVSVNEFYATNWLYNEAGSLLNTYEMILQRPLSYVVHCRRAAGSGLEAFKCDIAVDGLSVG